MNIFKNKRYRTIIAKEVEETIVNDENQMKHLYDEIDELKTIINSKDIEIKG